ncbi:MAG: chorismate synthase [Phycisphaerales bacterium]|nr:chorismate synthase [Phycisphaerales bacterium]
MPLRYQTAGESHGNSLVAIIDGVPEGLRIDLDFINHELHRRQGGYGRGARQRIESDTAEILAGTRAGVTIGSPLCLRIINRDHRLDDAAKTPPLSRPRPGHADLAGSLKYGTQDCRGTLERASARETAARVAAGAVARLLLRAFGMESFGFVRGAMDVQSSVAPTTSNWTALQVARDASEVACPDADASQRIIDVIHRAKTEKDTVGGWCETHIFGCVPGLGTCMNWDERLDARLAYAVMGIQAFKAVEIGLGRECAARFGSKVHDPIVYDERARDSSSFGYERASNNAGGLEGGMTNGMPIVVKGTMKPISTLLQGMPSVDLVTHEAVQSQYERSDVSAIAAASVVMEHVVAFEVARAFLLKFGGDTMREVETACAHYRSSAH